jgi:UDP-N-acetylmuramate--alanine ligase
VVTYALTTDADLTAEGISLEGLTSTFKVRWKGSALGEAHLNVPGLHNVSNALAAVAVGLELDIAFPTMRAALAEFSGVARRFQIKGQPRDIMVVDDYAHHPAEILATLKAAKDGLQRSVVAVFQPHRYTRTRALLSEFVMAFDLADRVIVTDIYPAGEPPIPGVSGRQIAEGLAQRGRTEVSYVSRRDEAGGLVVELARPGDLVITMGAGDIWKVSEEIVRLLDA